MFAIKPVNKIKFKKSLKPFEFLKYTHTHTHTNQRVQSLTCIIHYHNKKIVSQNTFRDSIKE